MEGRMAVMMQKVEGDDEAHKLEDLEFEYSTLDVAKAAAELYDLLCLCLK